MTAPRTGALSAHEAIAAIRGLLAHVDDGGAADYVRLAGGDPMDHDEHAKPLLAVPVADVERILDQVPPRIVILVDEAHDCTLHGTTGSGKNDAGDVQRLMGDILRAARSSSFNVADERPGWRSNLQYPSAAGLPGKGGKAPRLSTGKPVIQAPGDGPGPVASLVEAALHDPATPRPASADDLLNDPGRILRHLHRVGAVRRDEIVASLAYLTSAGHAALVCCPNPGTPRRRDGRHEGPAYIAAAAHQPDPTDEPALAVLIAEHLAQAGADGADLDALVIDLKATYEFRNGRPPVLGRVIAALSALTRRELAAYDAQRGSYVSAQHLPRY